AAAALAVLALAVARIVPRLAAVPVLMIGTLIHQGVGARVEVLAVHPLVVGAGNEMPEMAVDVVGEEHLAVVVVVKAPRIGGAVGDGLEDFADRVIAPDAAVDADALAVGRAGRADVRGRHDAVPAVEPAIRAPHQAVDDVVADPLKRPAVEDDFGLAV